MCVYVFQLPEDTLKLSLLASSPRRTEWGNCHQRHEVQLKTNKTSPTEQRTVSFPGPTVLADNSWVYTIITRISYVYNFFARASMPDAYVHRWE